MSKCYLFSGIDKVNGFTKMQAKYLKKDLSGDITITFIASSFDKYDVNDDYYNNMLKFFSDIGVNIKKSYLIDDRLSKEASIKHLNLSDAVFIMGGYPSEEMNNINKFDLINSLCEFDGVIMGVSAGSINMNKTVCFIDKDGSITEYNGIGITDFNLAPHFNFDRKDYIKEIELVSKKYKTLALPNDSFVIVNNGKIKIIGDHYFFNDGKIIN